MNFKQKFKTTLRKKLIDIRNAKTSKSTLNIYNSNDESDRPTMKSFSENLNARSKKFLLYFISKVLKDYFIKVREAFEKICSNPEEKDITC